MSIPRTSYTRLDLSVLDAQTAAAFDLDKLPLDRPTTLLTDLLRLDGKVALVTGGGGDGLGNSIAHRLAEQGATIVILDINMEAGQLAADDVARRWGVPTMAAAANVTSRSEVADAVGKIVAKFDRIDILVNNAGGSGAIGPSGRGITFGGPFQDNEADYVDTVVAVNLTGLLNVTQEVLKVMLQQQQGRIINVSSEGGKTWMKNLAVYNACKSGVNGFTRNLAVDVGPLGVSVVAVCPGIMVNQRILEAPIWQPGAPLAKQYERVTAGRPSMPDDVAALVVFLAAPAGSYIHGTSISVGGGIAD